MSIRIFLALALCVLTCEARAASAVDRLKSLIGASSSYQADFHQVVKDEKGAEMQVSDGQVFVQRPGRFRWKSEAPYNQLLVADGRELWRYDEDLEQVTVKKVDARLGNTPALLLSGDLDSLDKVFVVEAHGEQGFLLRPKDDAGNMFESLEIVFVQGKMARMVMKDSLRQTTVIEYRNVKTNVSLVPALFQFTPPAGVDVFRDEQ